MQTAGTAARKRKRRKIWIIAAAAALLIACIAYCIYGFAASDVEFDGYEVKMSGHITAITVGRAERLLSEHDCTCLLVAADDGLPTVSAFAMRRLGTLTNLTYLFFGACGNISDLSPLSNLTNLEVLDIRGTDVKSLNGLENSGNPRTLYVKDCDLTDTSALEVSGCMSALEY